MAVGIAVSDTNAKRKQMDCAASVIIYRLLRQKVTRFGKWRKSSFVPAWVPEEIPA
jgi:hypothetical protein